MERKLLRRIAVAMCARLEWISPENLAVLKAELNTHPDRFCYRYMCLCNGKDIPFEDSVRESFYKPSADAQAFAEKVFESIPWDMADVPWWSDCVQARPAHFTLMLNELAHRIQFPTPDAAITVPQWSLDVVEVLDVPYRFMDERCDIVERLYMSQVTSRSPLTEDENEVKLRDAEARLEGARDRSLGRWWLGACLEVSKGGNVFDFLTRGRRRFNKKPIALCFETVHAESVSAHTPCVPYVYLNDRGEPQLGMYPRQLALTPRHLCARAHVS